MERVLKKIDRVLGDLGISRARLARQIGVEQSYLQKMLSGRRPLKLDVLDSISEALGIPPWELMKGDEGGPLKLGVLEIPLVDPEAVLRAQLGGRGITMDQVKEVLILPRFERERQNSPPPGDPVAVSLPGCDDVFVVDIADRAEGGHSPEAVYLCAYGDLPHKFTVGRLIDAGEGFAVYGELGQRPVYVPRQGVLARVIWKLQSFRA